MNIFPPLFRPLLAVAATGIILSGCGFHLPQDEKLSDSCPELILAGDDNDIFYKILEEKLILSGVKVTPVIGSYTSYLKGDIPVLSCGPMQGNSKVLSVAGNAQNLEYTYKTSVACNLFTPGHRPYAIANTLNRSYLNRSGVTISTDAEKSVIIEESAENHADMVLIRLSNVQGVLPRLASQDAAAGAASDGVRVVFDPTSENSREMSLEEARKAPEMQDFEINTPESPKSGGEERQ
ncbi:MAG: hypothetical protein VZR11_00350 [Succinimonas sp.]|nr:hypothetical protein [Succinimonas sp.]